MTKKNPDLDYLAHLGFCRGARPDGTIRGRPFRYISDERRLEIGHLGHSEVESPIYDAYDLSSQSDRYVLENWSAMKTQLCRDFLDSLNIFLDIYDTGKVKGRPVRFLPKSNLFQVGDDNFDRWANSVGRSFDLGKKSDQRALIRWIGEE